MPNRERAGRPGQAQRTDLARLRGAAARSAGHAHRTPVFSGRRLDAIVGAQLLLKCLQRAGAFKFRGEDSIVRAIRLIGERLELVVEPSGAVPIAALPDLPQALVGKRIDVIVSGGNLDLDRLSWYRTRGDGGGGA